MLDRKVDAAVPAFVACDASILQKRTGYDVFSVLIRVATVTPTEFSTLL
jgi:hypothetical protein